MEKTLLCILLNLSFRCGNAQSIDSGILNSDGSLIDVPFSTGISELANTYFNYVFPDWKIPAKYNPKPGKIYAKPQYQTWVWNDMDCNIYHYWYRLHLKTPKRIVSFLSSPSFNYKVYDNGEVIVSNPTTNAVIAHKTDGTFSAPNGSQAVRTDAPPESVEAEHPCDLSGHLFMEVKYEKSFDKWFKITSASLNKNGKYIVLGGTRSDSIYRSGNTQSDFYAEIIDSRGNSLLKNIYKEQGKQSLSSILVVENLKKELLMPEKTNKELPDFNYLIAGTTADIGTPTHDFYVKMCGVKGKELWSKKFGGIGNDFCTAAITTKDGNFILAGISNSSASRDISKVKIGEYDFWCIKIDRNGNKIWDARFGTTADDILTSIEETNSGDILLGGFTSGLANFGIDSYGNSGSGQMPMNNYYIMKINSAGGFLWARLFGGSGNDRLYQIIPANNKENFYLWGTSDSKELFPADFDREAYFRSILDTTYKRTTTYMYYVYIDKDGNKVSSQFAKPIFDSHQSEIEQRKNVLRYGYVYRTSEASEFNKEYLYIQNPYRYAPEIRDYKINVGGIFGHLEQWKFYYYNDEIALGVHSEDTDRKRTHPKKKQTKMKKR